METLSLQHYLKILTIQPGSTEAVNLGCKCTRRRENDENVVTIDPHCPFHWQLAMQYSIQEISSKVTKTETFNKALKTGYVLLGLFLAGLMLFKL